MVKPSVLVVDDDAEVRATLRKFLKTLGITEIHEAVNGQEAVDQVKALPKLSLILLDLKMPIKDGLKALEEIREFNREIKIAILTGYPFYEQADQAARKWGILDFISKPVDLSYLERIVSIAVSEEK